MMMNSAMILTTEERSRRTKAMWDAMTPEERDEHRAKMREGWVKKRESKAKAKLERKRRIGEASKQKWAALTPEERVELVAKQQAGRTRTFLIRRGVKCGLGKNDLEELYDEHGEEELRAVVEWAEASGVIETPTVDKPKPKVKNEMANDEIDKLLDQLDTEPKPKPKAKRDPISLLDAIRTVTCRSDNELIAAFTEQVSKKVNISVSFYQAIEHYVREENERVRKNG
jgi:hypothetical protein